MKKLVIFVFICFSLIADTDKPTQKSNIRDVVTESYHKFLNSVDTFISNYDDINGSNYEEITKNKLYFILSLKDTKSDTLQSRIHLRGKIILPKLQDKVEIAFSKDDEERVDSQYTDSEYEDILKDTNFYVGLKYYAYKKPDSRAYAKISIKTHSPVGLYGKVGIYKSYLYHKLKTTFNHGLYYYIHDKKYAASSSVAFEFPIFENFSIGEKNRWYWNEKSDISTLRYTIWLYHKMDFENLLQYELSYATIDDDICDYCKDWYGVSVRFKHFVNKWFFFEIIPELLKKRENDFKLEKQFTFNFGITFSK